MPVIFNEPLSFLQRMVEYMEYAPLLRRAIEEQDPVGRMQVSVLPKEVLIFSKFIFFITSVFGPLIFQSILVFNYLL